jgi:hypothetical protein
MAKHICQGPKCHTYETQSRIRGPKHSKVLRTRQAAMNIGTDFYEATINSTFAYFCDDRCFKDWTDVHLARLMNIVGIKTRPSETPIEVIKETKTGWRGEYVDTTIKLLNQPTQDDTVTA